MRYVSAFSGIEAASVAWHPLGWHAVALIEFDAFPSEVLAHHYPNTPNLGDITKVTEDQVKGLGPVDVFVFGSPCQDLSVAGKRKGLDGERSGLFFDAMRLVRWLREHCGLRWAVWENVPGAFSSNEGRDFAAVVAALGGFEFVDVPPKGWGTEGAADGPQALVEWSTLDAQWFGVAQRRRRCFAVADFGDWTGRPPVLLEPDRLRGDSAPSREAGKATTTGTLRSTDGGSDVGHVRGNQLVRVSRARLRCGCGYEFPDQLGEYGCPNCEGDEGPARTISEVVVMAHGQGGAEVRDDGGAPCLTCNHEAPIAAIPTTAHTLRGEGFDTSEDGTGRGTPLVPDIRYAYYSHDYANDRITDPAGVNPALTANASSSGNLNVLAPAIAFHGSQDPDVSGDVTHPVGRNQGQETCVAVALRGREGGATAELGDEVQNCLRASSGGGDKPHVLTAMQVRRLTPRECERLQGFPDDYTRIPWRGKPADQCPDGPRYKALGNSMAVPVMRWIGRQIDFAHRFF